MKSFASPGVVKAGERVLACAHYTESEYRAWAWLGGVRPFAYTVDGANGAKISNVVDTQWIVMCLDCHAKYDAMDDTADNVLSLVDKIVQFQEDHKLAETVQA